MASVTPLEDIAKAEAFIKKFGICFSTVRMRERAIAELAHSYFEERVKGRVDGILEFQGKPEGLAKKAVKHISAKRTELVMNYNGRDYMVLQLDAPRKTKKKNG